jgi:hypothetical protein
MTYGYFAGQDFLNRPLLGAFAPGLFFIAESGDYLR